MKFFTYLIIIISVLSLSLKAEKIVISSFLNKGDALYESFKNEDALLYYQKAYELDKENPEVLLKLVRTYKSCGVDAISSDKPQTEKAQSFFEKAVETGRVLVIKSPDSATAHFELASSIGNLIHFKGRRQKVKLSQELYSHGSKSIKLAPNAAQGYVVLGIYYREVANLDSFSKKLAQIFFGKLPEGDLDDSEKMLRNAVKLSPETIYPAFQLAITLEQLDNNDEALKIYQEISKKPIKSHQDKWLKQKAKESAEKLK